MRYDSHDGFRDTQPNIAPKQPRRRGRKKRNMSSERGHVIQVSIPKMPYYAKLERLAKRAMRKPNVEAKEMLRQWLTLAAAGKELLRRLPDDATTGPIQHFYVTLDDPDYDTLAKVADDNGRAANAQAKFSIIEMLLKESD